MRQVTLTMMIMTTTRPLKPTEHHHQTRIHATIVDAISQISKKFSKEI
jgi:hypothetical protein